MKCGSPGYLAPEILNKCGYSYKADIFSLGCVFYKLLTNKLLFSGNSNEDLVRKNFDCNTHEQINFLRPLVSP